MLEQVTNNSSSKSEKPLPSTFPRLIPQLGQTTETSHLIFMDYNLLWQVLHDAPYLEPVRQIGQNGYLGKVNGNSSLGPNSNHCLSIY